MLLMNSCDIQDDAYLILNMDTELNAFGVGQNISTSSDFCLSDFNDYNDNVDNLEGIEYLNAAYFTTQSSNGLKGDLTLNIKVMGQLYCAKLIFPILMLMII
jgi:hypothetical protein